MKCANKTDTEMKIIQLSDLHFTDDENVPHINQESKTNLISIIEDLNSKSSGDEVIILSGDIVYKPTPELYRSLAEIFSNLEQDIFVIPGNHDDNKCLRDNFIGKNIFHNDILESENWVVMLLDSSHPGAKLGSGRLTEDSLTYLNETLADKSDKNAIVFIHHPSIPFGASWFKEICLENSTEFNEIIHRYPNVKAVISGHAHTQYYELIQNKEFITAPSTWLQFDHTVDYETRYKDEAPGYNWYLLKMDGTFNFGTEYCRS